MILGGLGEVAGGGVSWVHLLVGGMLLLTACGDGPTAPGNTPPVAAAASVPLPGARGRRVVPSPTWTSAGSTSALVW